MALDSQEIISDDEDESTEEPQIDRNPSEMGVTGDYAHVDLTDVNSQNRRFKCYDLTHIDKLVEETETRKQVRNTTYF